MPMRPSPERPASRPGSGLRAAAARLAGPLLLGSILAGCSASAPPATDPVRNAARSLGIVRSATAERPAVLKVLFYGQSISKPQWTDQALDQLRRRYPHVTFEARNLALGGWPAQMLERAAARDVAEFYPDLIVFHVYGDHRAYERIIRTFRSRTAADVIVQTDHVVEPVEPLCDEGLHLRWSPPPGCKGHLWFRQNEWSEFMSQRWIPHLAQQYGLAVEPRREAWNRYLAANRLPPSALIADSPHPNARGWALMADLFVGWFNGLVDRSGQPQPTTPALVTTLAPPAPGQSRRFEVTGNRLELIAAGPLDGKVRVSIDGKAPTQLDGCWIDSRVSAPPNMLEWPALKQVAVRPDYHQADRWSLRLSAIDPRQQSFAFTLRSARGGADGAGTTSQYFASPSGRVTIQPDDWTLAYASEVAGKGAPDGTILSWERRFLCHDEAPQRLGNGTVEQRHVLATGLANGRHVIELGIAPGAPRIFEIRVYRPPLER